jgi:signal transduction histidine kinase
MPKKNDVQQYSFTPGAMSIIQMGEELIGQPNTAINELVKNSYDADATNCKVYFHSANTKESSFTLIYDDGNGMDEDILFGDWLRPSVSDKRKKGAKSAVFERNLLGSKGIGRLASMALGRFVTVISRKDPKKDYNWITVDRELFKKEELLKDIKFPGSSINNYLELFGDSDLVDLRTSKKNEEVLKILKRNDLDEFRKGTLILIEDFDEAVIKILKKDFSESNEKRNEFSLRGTNFYKSLATLVTPISLSSEIQEELLEREIINEKKIIANNDDVFEIEFGINLLPEQEEYEIEWQPIEAIPILDVYDYRVFGKITDKGDVDGFLSFNRLGNDSFENSFSIPRKEIKDNSLRGKDQPSLFEQGNNSENELETGEYYFDFRVYDMGEADNRAKLSENAGFDNINTFRSTFKEFQGLRVSKNGFGVKPYGEEVEDWIGLSKARVQNPGQNVNTSQIIGYVFLYSPDNDKIEEKTNREGFLENTAFIQVKETLKVIFKNLGRQRYNYRLKHGLGRVPSSKHKRPDIAKFLKSIESSKSVSQARKKSEKFVKEITTSLDNLEEALTFSERLASLGSGIELVFHEMAQPISTLRTTKSSLDLKKDKIAEDVKEIFLNDINSLNSATDVLAELRKSLQPAIGRTRRKKFKPVNTFLRVCSLFKSDFEEAEIGIELIGNSEKITLKDYEYPFWIAFLNILNNAVYWIKRSEKPGKINFQIEDESIKVGNTGPLISEDVLEDIFEYGVTTRQEKNATGLGLSYTQSILSKNDWGITAENLEKGPIFIIKKQENE